MTRRPPDLLRGLVALVAAAAAGAGCARPSSPPGAADETRPPAVVSLTPPRDSVAVDFSGAAKVRFDEPIDVRSGLGRELVASPAYQYTVSVGHSEISVRPEGGWRPGAVYVLEFPAGIPDLLDNERKEPVRLVFSTGPPIRQTRVGLWVFDRVTGERQDRGRVLFLPAAPGDSAGRAPSDTATASAGPDTAGAVPYTAVADSTGRYELSHLPPGSYWAFGFVDQNRNLRLDRRLEPYDSTRLELGSDTARASGALFLLEPDSTPPRLARIEARDSVTLRLLFDDHLRPDHVIHDPVVRPEGGEGELPTLGARVLTAADTTARPAADSAAEDSVASDSVPPPGVPDSAARAEGAGAVADRAAGEEAAGLPPEKAAAGPGRGAAAPPDSAAADTIDVDKPPRPTRLVEIRLSRPLTPDTFRVFLREVQNMWRLRAEVDTTFAYVPPPDTAASDTAATDSPAPDSVPAAEPRDSAARADTGATDQPARLDSLPADSAASDTASRRP